jgi:hypothetical protein
VVQLAPPPGGGQEVMQFRLPLLTGLGLRHRVTLGGGWQCKGLLYAAGTPVTFLFLRCRTQNQEDKGPGLMGSRPTAFAGEVVRKLKEAFLMDTIFDGD